MLFVSIDMYVHMCVYSIHIYIYIYIHIMSYSVCIHVCYLISIHLGICIHTNTSNTRRVEL